MTNFSDLTIDEQQARLFGVAEAALSNWNLAGELSLIKQRENTVYRLVTNEGAQYALRVHRANYHSDVSLKSELAWMQALESYGIGVPQVIPTTTGEYFTRVKIVGVSESRQVDLLDWIEGEQIGSIERGLGDDPDTIRHIYANIGRVAAQVHNQSSHWTLPEGFERHAWNVEGLVGDNALWGKFWELEALTPEQRTKLLAAREQVRRELIEFGQASSDYSLIHADFVPENFLVDGDQVNIIDFDDAGFGWHLFELATALYSVQGDKHYSIARGALIEGYREHRPLPSIQLARLPLFLVVRGFTYLGWMHTRKGTETALELTPLMIEMCFNTLEHYLDQSDG
jgi:Ser/Thr protein kinase RdoA (MazF antagonist)